MIRGALDELERCVDAKLAWTKGGGDEIGLTKRGKHVKIMAIVDRHDLPLALTANAIHREVTLPRLAVGAYVIDARPLAAPQRTALVRRAAHRRN